MAGQRVTAENEPLPTGSRQGVAMAAALYRDIPIFEYSPKKIKQSVTGKGNSSKEQVSAMLQHLLLFKLIIFHFWVIMQKYNHKIEFTLDDVGDFLAKFTEYSEHVYWISSPDFKKIQYNK